MKRFYLRFRIILLTFAFSLASVSFLQYLSDRWNEIAVVLPQVESETPLYVFPKRFDFINDGEGKKLSDEEAIIQGRDLSAYGTRIDFSNCGVSNDENKKCVQQKIRARELIFRSWKAKQRAYLMYSWQGCDVGGDIYIFIEPDKYGKWHIIFRNVNYSESGKRIIEDTAVSVKYKRANKDYFHFKEDPYVLSFVDKNGKQIEAL